MTFFEGSDPTVDIERFLGEFFGGAPPDAGVEGLKKLSRPLCLLILHTKPRARTLSPALSPAPVYSLRMAHTCVRSEVVSAYRATGKD